MSADRQWLDSLVVGSPVAVCGSGAYEGNVSIRAVEKIHKLHFVVGGSKFNKRDGWAVVGRGLVKWSPNYLAPTNDDHVVSCLAAARRDALRKSLNILANKCVDEARLQAAIDALTVPS